MKLFVTILLIAFAFTTAKAQSVMSVKFDSASAFHIREAGADLKTAGILQVLGGVGIGLSAAMPVKPTSSADDVNVQKVLLYAGGLCELGALIEYFSGTNHLQKSGVLQVKPTGVTYKF